MMNLSIWHIIFMGITVAIVIGAGIYAARSVHSAEGYSLGGRSAGVPLIAGSIAGTLIGGGATVGTAQLAFSYGLAAWWFTLGSGIALAIMGFFYAREMRESGLATIPEFLSAFYGRRSEEMSSVISSIGILLSIIASTLPGIQIISAFFHVTPWTAAGILLLLVVLYTFFGGMKSAGVGGIMKMLVIFLSLFIAGYSAFEGLMAMPDFDTQFPPMPWRSLFGEGVQPAMTSFISVVVGVLCTQTYVQAIFSASTPVTAAAGCITAAAIIIPVGLPSVAIGMYMHAVHPETLPILVLPAYLIEYESTLLAGVAMGGIMLSLIGSIGGLSLGVATMVSHDMIALFFKIKDDKKLLLITRLSVVAVILIASVVSIVNLESEVLFWNYLSMALRGGGIFLPLTLAVFKPGCIKPSWALASMGISTLASILTATIYPLPLSPLFVGLIVSVVILIPGYFVRRIERR